MRRINLLILWPLVTTALPFGANVVDRYDGRKRDDTPAYIGLAEATAVIGVGGAIGGTVIHESVKGAVRGFNGMVQNEKARRKMKLENMERARLQKLADQRAKTEWSKEKLNQKSQCISDAIAMYQDPSFDGQGSDGPIDQLVAGLKNDPELKTLNKLDHDFALFHLVEINCHELVKSGEYESIVPERDPDLRRATPEPEQAKDNNNQLQTSNILAQARNQAKGLWDGAGRGFLSAVNEAPRYMQDMGPAFTRAAASQLGRGAMTPGLRPI